MLTILKNRPVLRTQLLFTLIYIIASFSVVYVMTNFVAKMELVHDTRLFLAVQFVLVLVSIPAAFVIAGLALKKLKRIFESQKLFISNASHELKNPIAVIKLNSELALIENNKEKAHEMIRDNIEELDRMAKIVDTIHKLSNINYSIAGLSLSKVNICDVVSSVKNMVSRQFAEKNIQIKCEADTRAIILGNQTALEEMLFNLLKNSIAHTPEGGSVIIRTANKKDFIRLSVEDTGAGISRQDLPHILNPWYRSRLDRSMKTEGSGLGLAIVNDIVKYHNGKIEIKSEVGKGTEVVVDLPRF